MQLQDKRRISKLKIALLFVLIISVAFVSFESYLIWKNKDILQHENQKLSELLREKLSLNRNISEAANRLETLKRQISELQKNLSRYGFPLKPTDIENYLSRSAVNCKLVLDSARVEKKGMFINVESEFHGKEKDILKFVAAVFSSIPLQLQDFELSKPEKDVFVKMKFKIPTVGDVKVEDK